MSGIDKIKRLLEKLVSTVEPLNPSVFNDPIAEKCSWRPLKGGGSNFQTRKLIVPHNNRIEFVPALGMKIFSGIFAFIGLAMLLSMLIFSDYSDLKEAFWIVSSIGIVFATAGIMMFYFTSLPVVFDKDQGYFWKGNKAPNQVYRMREIKKAANLNEIHALQIIEEYISSDKSSYYSYELNIILKDAERMNVTDHGNYQKLVLDAVVLSEFLGIPLWDAVMVKATNKEGGTYNPILDGKWPDLQ